MKLKFPLPRHTEGFITAETAICCASLIILFALFFTLTGYCRAYQSVKEFTDKKARDAAVLGYALGFDVPGILSANGFEDVKNGSVDNLMIYCESWGEELKLNASYTYSSMLGKFRVKVSSMFTKWAGDDLNEESVWLLSPIDRGKMIESIFGGDLDEFFPVIDAYDEISGHAASIVSVDTTLEIYQTGTGISKVIREKIDDLNKFTYGEYEGFVITEYDIESRELVVVLPENLLNEKQLAAIDECAGYAAENSIIFTVKRYHYVPEKTTIQSFAPWEAVE